MSAELLSYDEKIKRIFNNKNNAKEIFNRVVTIDQSNIWSLYTSLSDSFIEIEKLDTSMQRLPNINSKNIATLRILLGLFGLNKDTETLESIIRKFNSEFKTHFQKTLPRN